MTEFEKKLLLSERQYLALRNGIRDTCKRVIQTNYYFDTPDYRFNHYGLTFRIREKNGKLTATVKEHNCQNEELHIERSAAVASLQETDFFKNKRLMLHGALTTYRDLLYADAALQVFLDRSVYLGVEDYELEIEYENGKESYANIVFQYFLGITYYFDPSYSEIRNCNKSQRFFRRLIDLKKQNDVERSNSGRFTH